MITALDFGTFRLKSLHRDGDRLVGRSCRSVYSVVPDTQKYRDILRRLETPFAICDGALTVFGDHAEDLTWLCQIPTVPLMPDGVVPDDDPPARQMLGALIERLLPDATSDGELCCMTLPGSADRSPGEQSQQREVVTQIVRLRGYVPVIVNSGFAAVLAESSADGFTGIGLSCGAEETSFSIVHQGREYAHGCVPLAGNWIDRQLATHNSRYCWDGEGNCYLDTRDAARWKHSFGGSILEPQTVLEQMLREEYENLFDALAARMLQSVATLSRATPVASRPLPIVCTGGSTRVIGFAELLHRALRNATFPLRISHIRVTDDPQFTVTRGCLINAELELTTSNGDHRRAG